ncbi:hypothetical protein MJO28_017100 [Puccinia striiformis f. sp. tritici]|nr:hypothetical protein MJO28_017100 [Puccinia striiformis f. sp. tritici]
MCFSLEKTSSLPSNGASGGLLPDGPQHSSSSNRFEVLFQRDPAGKTCGRILSYLRFEISNHRSPREIMYVDQCVFLFLTVQAVEIKPPRGSYPKGAYHNANRISPFLFSSKSKNERNEDLSKKHMPFLFNLLASKLADRPARRKKDNPKDTVDVADSCSEASEPSDIEEEEEYMFNGKSRNIPKPKLLLDHGQQASKACIQSAPPALLGMGCNQHTFISKRRHNGHQIANSISFLACGVTDRISKLLQFIGLSASQRTAQNVLKSQPPSRKTDQYIDVPYSPNTSTLPLL